MVTGCSAVVAVWFLPSALALGSTNFPLVYDIASSPTRPRFWYLSIYLLQHSMKRLSQILLGLRTRPVGDQTEVHKNAT
jgi:hypothetical protein